MKSLLLLLAILLLTATASLAQTVYKTVEWTEFRSEEGGFKATFPNRPTKNDQEVNGPAGKIPSVQVVTIVAPSTFMVTYADYPKSAPSDVQALRAHYDGFSSLVIQGTGSKLIGQRDAVASGQLGREIEATIGRSTVKYRVYWVGNRLYQVITSVPTETASEPEIQKEVAKFLDSFELIKKDEK
jgi:hypothetical protein